MTDFNKEIALEQYNKRREENKGKQIDNSSLHAGSPMYFYCRFCAVQTEVLPELYTKVPCTICAPCKVLHEHGLI